MTDAVRNTDERKSDTLARLEGDADVWVATASAGRAHLVPLSLASGRRSRHPRDSRELAHGQERRGQRSDATRARHQPRRHDH